MPLTRPLCPTPTGAPEPAREFRLLPAASWARNSLIPYFPWPDSRLRRMTVRRHGFASVHAGAVRGELLTRPLTFTGSELIINCSTSAAGSIRVELQGMDGEPLPGFRLGDCTEVFGDEIEQAVTWKTGKDVSRFADQPIRLRFVMTDADLYTVRFRP